MKKYISLGGGITRSYGRTCVFGDTVVAIFGMCILLHVNNCSCHLLHVLSNVI